MSTAELLNINYANADDRGMLSLIRTAREGISFATFAGFVEKSPFDLNDWSIFLHLSERTMQRYKKEARTFDAQQSEKILEIALLYNKGIEVFGNADKFNLWVDSPNLALGRILPKSLMDSSFGLSLLKDELVRIEYGILA
ncbi:type II RES/Xre toxin-antitoxin system antitoxin [Flavobacterium psychrotrophum]|uniref:type II RES/Xre toxin-antitoxin system antitoxin n=1 Tax=Flavobacterium psychrotrophum TaxID=2294119 RepID=UPI000E31FD8E|nr:antitoxin Xre-like helix-turn-helix domain-containing protein [Flavobacterium psychrotrophum]